MSVARPLALPQPQRPHHLLHRPAAPRAPGVGGAADGEADELRQPPEGFPRPLPLRPPGEVPPVVHGGQLGLDSLAQSVF